MHLLALQSRGCKCAILLTGEQTAANFLRAGMNRSAMLDYARREDVRVIENPVVHVWPLRLFRNPLERRKNNILRGAEKRLEKYIREEGRPDFIFHHGIFDYCYLTHHLSRKFDLPVRYLENSPKIEKDVLPVGNPFDDDAFRKEFVRKVEMRFAATDDYVKKMEAVFGVKFRRCPNVVTDDFFAEGKIEKPTDRFRFVNVAILTERKNQKLLIEAFADQFAGQEKYSLVIAGDGPLKSELEALARSRGVADQVEILGFIDRERVISLLDESHVFVLPSHSETFGVVVVEAMARGLPAITADIDGTREIILPENGVVFPPNDREALGLAMIKMAREYDSYNFDDVVASVRRRYGPDALVNALLHGNELR